MKIGILTFHAAHNYGSMLLAFALQEALRGVGHDVMIINHRIYAQRMMYANPLKFNHKVYIKSLFTHPLLFFSNAKKWRLFEQFSCKHHRLTKLCSTLVDVEQVLKEEHFDAVITGGDQIWNMNSSDFSLAYFLPFDIPNMKKISYSPSFGGGGYFKPEHFGNSIKGLLQDYDYISVREESASQFLSELLKRDVCSVCDPTLLLDFTKYSELAGDRRLIQEKYIFYYSPFSTPATEKIALEYGKQMGLPVYTSNGQPSQCHGMKRLQDSGPIEFLNLIKYSELVCGNSFHMAVFSILLHKEFFVLSKADARMESLLKKLGISGRFIGTIQQVASGFSRIDWENVDERLQQERVFGMNFLAQSLRR